MCGFAGLYVMASQCYFVGRIDAAIRYTEAAEKVISTGGVKVPHGASGFVGGAYVFAGQPDRWIQWCRIRQACGDDLHVFITACLLVGLTVAGLTDEAVAAAHGLTEAAEATGNPYVISFVLLAYGLAVINADPSSSLASLRQGMAIAQDSGNRSNEAHFAANLCRHEALYGDPLAAIDSFAVAIRNYHDSGNAIIRSVLGLLAAFFDRLGRYEAAATIAGSAGVVPGAITSFAETARALTHLREVLGDQTYESLARKGETMTTAAMATYAYDQIDQARTTLEHPS